nr:hypothetical protein CFP56_22964 [Quercus suber]
MPMGIASLTELLVLKGFVVGNLESNIDNSHQGLPRQFLGGICFPQKRDSCTPKDLIKLKKLRKFSINTSIKAFPREEELEALEKLKALRKLAIAWSVNSKQRKKGGSSSADSMNSDNGRQDSETTKPTRAPNQLKSRQPDWGLLGKLEKLVLQSFLDSNTPNWLMPGKLKKLTKLYIGGGKLISLGKVQEGIDCWVTREASIEVSVREPSYWDIVGPVETPADDAEQHLQFYSMAKPPLPHAAYSDDSIYSSTSSQTL